MPFIHVTFKDKRIATYELDDKGLTIGRTPKNDIVIDNPGVSSAHARILKKDDDYYIEDLDSKNGTYVKGNKIERRRLDFGDVITIFKHQLLFVPIVGSDAPMTDKGAKEGIIHQVSTLEVDMSGRTDLMESIVPGERVELVVFDGKRSRTLYLSDESYCIGKGSNCLVRTSGLMAPSVSARLMRQEFGYLLIPERVGEVSVNGMAIEGPYQLNSGDDIDIRKLRMIYKVEKPDSD